MMWGAWQCCSAQISLGVKQTPRVSLGNIRQASVMATVILKPSSRDKALGSEDCFIKTQSLNKLKQSEQCNRYIFRNVWEHRLSGNRVSHLTVLPSAFQNLIELQHRGDELWEVIAKLEKGDNVSEYTLLKGVLYCHANARCRPQIAVPRAIVPTLFECFHTYSVRGHLGVLKTIKKVDKSSSGNR